jgi:hypothetical protein
LLLTFVFSLQNFAKKLYHRAETKSKKIAICKKEGEIMRVEEVAKLLNTTPATIRIGLQQGVFPFGVAFKTKEANKNYTYVIYPEKVRQYAGEQKEGEST